MALKSRLAEKFQKIFRRFWKVPEDSEYEAQEVTHSPLYSVYEPNDSLCENGEICMQVT